MRRCDLHTKTILLGAMLAVTITSNWYVEYLIKRKGKEKVGLLFHKIKIFQKKVPTNL
jgi:hypothetical protein